MVSGPAWIAGAAAGSPAVRSGLAGAGERVDCQPRVVQLAGAAKVAGWRMMLRVAAAPTTVLRLVASGGGAAVAVHHQLVHQHLVPRALNTWRVGE